MSSLVAKQHVGKRPGDQQPAADEAIGHEEQQERDDVDRYIA